MQVSESSWHAEGRAVLRFAQEDAPLVVQYGGRRSWGTQERSEEGRSQKLGIWYLV